MFQSNKSNLTYNGSTSLHVSHNPFAKRMNPTSDIKTFIIRAQNASDIQTKFDTLDEIIKEFPVNVELSRFFTELLAEIFGLGDFPGWRLNVLDSRSHSDELLFKKVNDFMSPDGSLFKLIEKLENDSATFEFPSVLLPRNMQDPILRGSSSFANTQQGGMISGSNVPWSKNLGALEYYLFLFFSYILQPSVQKEPIDWNGDILYLYLFKKYMLYFLPLKEVLNLDTESSSSSNSFFSRQDKASKVVSARGTNLYANRNSPNFHVSNEYTSDARSIISTSGLRRLRPVTWKSEIFVQTMSNLWLTYDQVQTQVQTQDYYLPGTDQVLMIRMFIKHMHHFLNEKRPISAWEQSSTHSTSVDHEEELKRVVISMVQQRLYHFMKNCFLHWPLDASFQMICEAWLSYIQPWRYQSTDASMSHSNLNHWSGFIKENLIFYTVLFKMFMQRATRLDLQFLRDVQFIFRVTKVFSQPNLPELLQEAENSILVSSSHASMQPFSCTRLGSSYAAFRPSPKASELEDTVNESMFDQAYIQQMQEMAKIILNEAEAIRKEAGRSESDKSASMKRNWSLFGKIKEFFANTMDDKDISSDTKLEEKLFAVYNQLAAIFNFDPPLQEEESNGRVTFNEGGKLPKPFISDKCYEDGRLLPEHVVESNGSITLTEKGRLQILHKLRHFDIQGTISTDLEPVKSYEIHSLVRLLHGISSKLNEKYKEQLKSLYNKDDLAGDIFRTLSPKVMQYHGVSMKLPQIIKVGDIQPRISLRFLASYYSIYYICWLFFIIKLFGLGMTESVLLLLFTFVLFALHNVVSTPLKINQNLLD